MLEMTCPVLGIPVTFRSNQARVLEIAALAFAGGVAVEAGPGCRVDIQVAPPDGDDDETLSHEVSSDRVFTVRIGQSRGRSDPHTWTAEAVVTPGLVERTDYIRYHLVEALTLWLVTHLDRCPLHAAALGQGDRALLLTGRSGSGKSTLTYAAFREGLQVLSEDTVFVQTDPVVRVWGLPGHLHLTPDSTRFFPELASAVAEQRANGKTKVAVSLHRPGSAPPPFADRVGICVIRQGAELRAEPLSPVRAAEEVASHSEGGFGYWRDQLRAAVESIGATGGWMLTVPPEPGEAVQALREMLETL